MTATVVKERPILFSAPMVRALLDGSKTQTRRAVKLPRTRDAFVLEDHGAGWWPYQSDDGESSLCNDGMEHPYTCPYGKPGDRLWVRENGWERPERTPRQMREGADTWAPYYFDADGLSWSDAEDLKAWGFKRRPSIHMPRWASRILLEITNVRVERLQDISESDARAEGCDPWNDLAGVSGVTVAELVWGYRRAYAHLWDQINGAGAWDANPWVWAVSFKRIEGAKR